MKFLYVTYRWGEELIGGAEISHRRLAQDLVDMGHEVEVWTTTGSEIAPIGHWGVAWQEGYQKGTQEGVTRFSLSPNRPFLLKAGAKLLQRRIEAEWGEIAEPFLHALLVSSDRESLELLDGWHYPETQGNGEVWRWSWTRSRFAIPARLRHGTVWVNGMATMPMGLSAYSGSLRLAEVEASGHFSLTIPIDDPPSDIIELRTSRPFRPWRDHRTLGVMVNEILYRSDGEAGDPASADLAEDHRALGRRSGSLWWDHLWQRAMDRPDWMGKLFDWLRGPRCPALWKALRNPPVDVDYIILGNLPWAMIAQGINAASLPVLAIAFMHMDDEYYYWRQYFRSLQRASLTMAMTEFSAKEFFQPRGINGVFVGSGVPLPPEVPEFDIEAWKIAHGISPEEAVVLTICRKSPEKRYATVSEAVGQLRAAGRSVRHVLIGPDADRRAVPKHVLALGRVSEDVIEQAYRACDVLVLMSESESFGIVVIEAWLRGKPVIANEFCGPTSSLISPGRDGLLARDARTLAGAIVELLDNPDRAKALGIAGKQKAERHYTQRAATERLLKAIEDLRR